MQMTIKTQSPKIDTALPSDPQSEWTSSAGDVTHRTTSVRAKSPVGSGSRVCSHCGAKIDVCHVEPLRTPELIFNCLCVVLLIAVVWCVGYLFNSWAEHGFDNFFDHRIWHEPLRDWEM